MAINDILISENFRLSEFQSRDTGEVMVDPDLIRKVQTLRDLVRLPIRINSGYRTPERNREVGGVPNSLHCQGKAVDVSCAFISLAALTVGAIEAGFQGVIVYTKYSFLHCDLRETRQYLVPADWCLWLPIIFPQYKLVFFPWSQVQDAAKLEV